jgi:Zn-dependent protease
MDSAVLLHRVVFLIPLILSLTVHEWAHAWSAHRLGDDTAERLGRLTLNPLSHIDPIGTILLPLAGVPFGWAKPVPVNPARFRRDVNVKTGMMVTAAAGPLSNLALAFLCVIVSGLLLRFTFHTEAIEWLLGGGSLRVSFFELNALLAVFNMLPIPPLDGSRVADGLMPSSLRPTWERFTPYGPFLLLALLILPQQFGLGFLRWPLMGVSQVADSLLRVIAGV